MSSSTKGTIAIDGSAGTITLDDVPLVEAQVDERFERILGWADDALRLGVRANADANADTPEDAAAARAFGAEGSVCAGRSTCSWRPVARRA